MTNNNAIQLTTKAIILNLLGDSVEIIKSGYKLYPSAVKDLNTLEKELQSERQSCLSRIWRLEKQGYIKRFEQQKKNIIKLTPLGQKQALKYVIKEYQIKKPQKWDKKWRIVIFDIPEEKQNIRKAVRIKLKSCGFYQLQKSVWIHPFECKELIWNIKYVYSASAYIQYLVVETLETELDLVGYFYEKKILNKKLL